MYEILDDISKGDGTPEHLNSLEELALVLKDTTMCGLGQTASNPVLSTLSYFRDEYEQHIWQKRCDAFACEKLVGAPCQSACPAGTEAWRYIALLRQGEYEAAYRVIREPNPFPSVCARVCHHPCEDRCRAGATGGQPVAIRALKRLITDKVDPQTYKPARAPTAHEGAQRIAVVGSGPAGLTAAHDLSLQRHKVTVYEAETQPGGLLLAGIPEFRLPQDVVRREIELLMDENITLKCDTMLGRDITIDSLFEEGFKAVFLAIGAHKNQRLNLEGEDVGGVYTGMEFLKRFNLHRESLAKGRVGVVGGGNCAVDAARVAIRQEGVENVIIIYRRTRREMPAFEEEINAAIEEGILLETLISPVKIHAKKAMKKAPLEEEIAAAVEEGVSIKALTSPLKIRSQAGRLTGIECIRNELGDIDSSGRRRPVPVAGTEHTIALDTLIVAIGEQPDVESLSSAGIEISRRGTLVADPETLRTSRQGVFAGGDVVSGPNTIIEAIADGKRAALMIDRYVKGEELKQPYAPALPRVYVEPTTTGDEESLETPRAKPPMLPIESRRRSFAEVEKSLSVEDATREAGRCLRCDLEFTQPKDEESELSATREDTS